MNVSSELYLSILAMDSYKRGHDAGISIDDGFPAGATFLKQSNPSPDSLEVQSGFYAIAYTLGSDAPLGSAGTTVISYRGTDNQFGTDIAGGDVINGWLASARGLSSQTGEALELYHG